MNKKETFDCRGMACEKFLQDPEHATGEEIAEALTKNDPEEGNKYRYENGNIYCDLNVKGCDEHVSIPALEEPPEEKIVPLKGTLKLNKKFLDQKPEQKIIPPSEIDKKIEYLMDIHRDYKHLSDRKIQELEMEVKGLREDLVKEITKTEQAYRERDKALKYGEMTGRRLAEAQLRIGELEKEMEKTNV